MKLVVTVDVEEEGLFCGAYQPGDAPVKNVANLKLLDPVFMDLGIRPALFVTYQAARDGEQRKIIHRMVRKWRGEIGAHLHPWNTPPLSTSPFPEPVPSEMIAKEVLAEKTGTLLKTLCMLEEPTVGFRMGRFNMGPRMFSILESTQMKIDSSIAPMRQYYGGPAHLRAPTDPYFPDPKRPAAPGDSHILEAPVTILPLIKGLGRVLEHLERTRLVPPSLISWFAMNLGSLPAQPMLTGLNRLKAAAGIHAMRGGRVLTLFFHSSELFPGGCQRHPTMGHVECFLEKLRSFLSWLVKDMKCEPVTLSGLYDAYRHAPSSGE